MSANVGRPKASSVVRAARLKKADTAKLIADIARGVPVAVACAAVGIHKVTFNSWLDERPDFARSLAAEKQAVILEALTAIKSCATKEREFRNWSWFLETVYRDYFAPPDKGPHINLTQNTLNLINGQTLEEARAALDEVKRIKDERRSTERGDSNTA